MSAYDPRRNNRISRARERQMARAASQHDDAMAVPREARQAPSEEREPVGLTAQFPVDTEALRKRAGLMVRDAMWYARYKPSVWRWTALIGGLVLFYFMASHLFPGRIFPNVYALGVPLGGLTVDEAEHALNEAWDKEMRIALVIGGETVDEVRPSEIGLSADTRAAAEAARGIGLSGIPFGYSIETVISLNYRVAEDYLVASAINLNRPAANASYTFRDNIIVGVPGVYGVQLEITPTLTEMSERPEDVVRRRRLEVVTMPIEPDYPDPEPYLVEARRIANEPFQLIGYDPFTDTSTIWATPPQNLATWLEVGEDGLTVNGQRIARFLEMLNEEIARTNPLQYITQDDAVLALQTALKAGERSAHLRISHFSQRYTIQGGDSAHAIARRSGIPYFMIAEANPGRDLGLIYPGDEITLPSKDAVIPLPVIPEKRIVVDLMTQMLYGFENGEEAFSWPISSGMNTAPNNYPTSPGVYQILSHEEIAYGSSITMCNSVGKCEQWQMYWFMGMYEIATNLQNGFHGQVLLPNGATLMGDQVGEPYTFGCVMSRPEEAEFLYHWADDGVVVEIISSEFEPTSELGRRILAKRLGRSA